MPSLMATRWFGQSSGPIFRRFWIEVNRIKLVTLCEGVFNVVFRLNIKIVEFRRHSRSSREVVRNRGMRGTSPPASGRLINYWRSPETERLSVDYNARLLARF